MGREHGLQCRACPDRGKAGEGRFVPMIATTCLVWLSAFAFGGAVSGNYGPLALGFDSAAGRVEGLYQEASGWDEAIGAPRFSCFLRLGGRWESDRGELTVRTSPGGGPEGRATLRFLPDRRMVLRFSSFHGGACPSSGRDDTLALDSARPWIGMGTLRVRSWFHSAPEPSRRTRAYVLPGDAVWILEWRKDFARVEFTGLPTTEAGCAEPIFCPEAFGTRIVGSNFASMIHTGRILPAVPGLLALVACQGQPARSVHSTDFPTLEAKVKALEEVVTFRRHYRELEFDAQLGPTGGMVPGPQDVDLSIRCRVPPEELGQWIAGLASLDSLDGSLRDRFGLARPDSGAMRWFGDGSRLVGVDSLQGRVQYRLLAH